MGEKERGEYCKMVVGNNINSKIKYKIFLNEKDIYILWTVG